MSRCTNFPCQKPRNHTGPCSSDDHPYVWDEWDAREEAGTKDLEDQLDDALDRAFGHQVGAQHADKP